MMPSYFVYAGLVLLIFGAITLIKPIRKLGIRSRGRSVWFVGAGLLAIGVAWVLPIKEVRVAEPRTQLDQLVPVYQFSEFHSVVVGASRQRTYEAIKKVTAGEIALFQTLTWIRRLGRSRPESIINAPPSVPLLDVATRTSFLFLADKPDEEIVIATGGLAPGGHLIRLITAEDFRQLSQPGLAVAVMNFRLEDHPSGGCLVTSETRVYATEPFMRRRFARYWSLIYPGSALIRRMWLRAIRKRAERNTP